MQIGELARRTGCDVETIRFYEREALLDKPARDPNGYRRYDDSHLTQLGFIRHCRSLDIALSDIRTLLALSADPSLACGEINDLIDRQIAGVHDRIESLRQFGRSAEGASQCMRTRRVDRGVRNHRRPEARTDRRTLSLSRCDT